MLRNLAPLGLALALAACGANNAATGSTGAREVLRFNTTNLPTAYQFEPFGADLQVAGGVNPYTLRVTNGTLPPGLRLNGRRLEGTPTTQGRFQFIVEATDANLSTRAQTFAVSVGQLPPLGLVPAFPAGEFRSDTRIPLRIDFPRETRAARFHWQLPPGVQVTRVETGSGGQLLLWKQSGTLLTLDLGFVRQPTTGSNVALIGLRFAQPTRLDAAQVAFTSAAGDGKLIAEKKFGAATVMCAPAGSAASNPAPAPGSGTTPAASAPAGATPGAAAPTGTAAPSTAAPTTAAPSGTAAAGNAGQGTAGSTTAPTTPPTAPAGSTSAAPGTPNPAPAATPPATATTPAGTGATPDTAQNSPPATGTPTASTPSAAPASAPAAQPAPAQNAGAATPSVQVPQVPAATAQACVPQGAATPAPATPAPGSTPATPGETPTSGPTNSAPSTPAAPSTPTEPTESTPPASPPDDTQDETDGDTGEQDDEEGKDPGTPSVPTIGEPPAGGTR
ncbi:putative Ig domain-containing protein [Deinococcus peraridilitoris]|uniref:Uncharacterized protein n=1 Tax=Deinococcus peraridilitoris (strain DSM 19664 / LMG 22246 / CIP 109416 / KR-200) TaxID=937777 RepID=L0A731_DEIPD|nr:putative Ig domain-containing protein [Deinococcus peraridilitoris]AFZ68997.1 hypothetical protein Deipe_3567 [Deinococcus peraridilitoris DSM 19664]